jgi:hypothetical protein
MAGSSVALQRRKLALRGALLSNRARIQDLRVRNAQIRAELQQHAPRRRPEGGTVTGIRKVSLGGSR